MKPIILVLVIVLAVSVCPVQAIADCWDDYFFVISCGALGSSTCGAIVLYEYGQVTTFWSWYLGDTCWGWCLDPGCQHECFAYYVEWIRCGYYYDLYSEECC